MSTKTIAVEARVHDRLTAAKRDGESFSETIDRLLTEVASAHTGSEILRKLATIAPLSDADAEVFINVIAENRGRRPW